MYTFKLVESDCEGTSIFCVFSHNYIVFIFCELCKQKSLLLCDMDLYLSSSLSYTRNCCFYFSSYSESGSWKLCKVVGSEMCVFLFFAVNNVHPGSGSNVSSHQHSDPSRNARINNTYVASHPMENGLPPDPSPPSGYPHQHRSPAAQPSPTVR